METNITRLRELTIRYSVKRDDNGQPLTLGDTLSAPREAAELLVTLLQNEPAEVFAILCLTTKQRLIADHEVSRGQLDATVVLLDGLGGGNRRAIDAVEDRIEGLERAQRTASA